MFTDDSRWKAQEEIQRHDNRAFSQFLTPDLFKKVAEQTGVPIGKSPLNWKVLVLLGIACAIHRQKAFATVLDLTLRLLIDAEGYSETCLGQMEKETKKRVSKNKNRVSKHNPHGTKLNVSEEAFVQARMRMPLEIWVALLNILADRCAERHAEKMRFKKFRLLALDGTTINLPRYKSNLEYFGAPSNKALKKWKKGGPKPTPQARLVMLQCPLTRTPVRCVLNPLKPAEITSAIPLCESLRNDDLVLMDRGFWSFGMFWDIQNQGAYFGIRLKSKIKFRTVRRLGPKDRIVKYAPVDKNRKWKKQGYVEPIQLRIIDYQIPGFRKSSIVTNVLDPEELSRDDWVRFITENEAGRNLTPGLYHRRWEIETTFKELKVQQGLEGNLRGRTPESVQYEIYSHLVLYLLTRWLILEAASQTGQDPLRLSFKGTLDGLEEKRVLLIISSAKHVSKHLLPKLIKDITTHVVPLRPGRHFPRPKDTQTKNKGYGQKQKPAKLTSKINKSTQKITV
jgi:hypothetical protein